MYRISSTDTFHHGRTFDSLAAAKQFADRRSEKQPGTPFDVVALVDREYFRVAYSPTGDAKLGTYKKVETTPGLVDEDMETHRATKHEFGWLYRGYLLDHAMNENCDYTRGWRVSEKNSSGDWEVFDQFSTLKFCKELIDQWKS